MIEQFWREFNRLDPPFAFAQIHITPDARRSQANARLSLAAPTLSWPAAAGRVLDHVEEAARLFIVIVAVDGGFLDQLVQVRWRDHHATAI